MSDELKPCPFCGGPARTLKYNGAMQALCSQPFEKWCAGADVMAPVAMWKRRAEDQMTLVQAEGHSATAAVTVLSDTSRKGA